MFLDWDVFFRFLHDEPTCRVVSSVFRNKNIQKSIRSSKFALAAEKALWGERTTPLIVRLLKRYLYFSFFKHIWTNFSFPFAFQLTSIVSYAHMVPLSAKFLPPILCILYIDTLCLVVLPATPGEHQVIVYVISPKMHLHLRGAQEIVSARLYLHIYSQFHPHYYFRCALTQTAIYISHPIFRTFIHSQLKYRIDIVIQ